MEPTQHGLARGHLKVRKGIAKDSERHWHSAMAGHGQEGAGGDAQAHLAAATAALPRQLPFGQGFTGFMHVHPRVTTG